MAHGRLLRPGLWRCLRRIPQQHAPGAMGDLAPGQVRAQAHSSWDSVSKS